MKSISRAKILYEASERSKSRVIFEHDQAKVSFLIVAHSVATKAKAKSLIMLEKFIFCLFAVGLLFQSLMSRHSIRKFIWLEYDGALEQNCISKVKRP